MTLDLSCRDWEQHLLAGRSLVPDLVLPDPGLGDRAVAAYNMLRLADVPGTPTNGEAGGPWFLDIVRALFASLDPATKARLITELFVMVPKKNNKTGGGAHLMLTALLLNERPRGRFALMAPVQDTAEEAFNAAAGAIALDPVLERKLHVRDHLKTIVHRETKAELEVMTFDPDVLTGKKFVGTLIDELHVIAKNSKAAKALRQVRGGMVPFPEAFLAFITTQSEEAPMGVFKAELAKARGIRDGKLVGKMLAVLYEFPRAMQQDKAQPWRDPKLWPLVTPNLNRSVTLDKLKELYDDAHMKGEEEMRGWASQHLNIEIGLALMSDSWAGAAFWEAAEEDLSLDELLERCEVAAIGIDGGGLDDLLGLYVIGRERDTGSWLGWGRAWAHEIVLQRRKDIAAQLRDLAAAGELTIVKEVGEDVAELAAIVAQVNASGLLDRSDEKHQEAIGVDPVGIAAVVDGLLAEGIRREQIIGISQGWKMAGAIKDTERALAAGTFLPGRQPLMRFCVGNAKVEPRGNAIIITKQASGSAKIDPLLALFDAVHLIALNPESQGRSFWESAA